MGSRHLCLNRGWSPVVLSNLNHSVVPWFCDFWCHPGSTEGPGWSHPHNTLQVKQSLACYGWLTETKKFRDQIYFFKHRIVIVMGRFGWGYKDLAWLVKLLIFLEALCGWTLTYYMLQLKRILCKGKAISLNSTSFIIKAYPVTGSVINNYFQ